MNPSAPGYVYSAIVIDVIDGDTIRCDVDVGFSLRQRMVFRLLGINTPEMVGAARSEGIKARLELAGRIEGKSVIIKTHKDKKEKYGRYLADVYINGESVNEDMLKRWPAYADKSG